MYATSAHSRTEAYSLGFRLGLQCTRKHCLTKPIVIDFTLGILITITRLPIDYLNFWFFGLSKVSERTVFRPLFFCCMALIGILGASPLDWFGSPSSIQALQMTPLNLFGNHLQNFTDTVRQFLCIFLHWIPKGMKLTQIFRFFCLEHSFGGMVSGPTNTSSEPRIQSEPVIWAPPEIFTQFLVSKFG